MGVKQREEAWPLCIRVLASLMATARPLANQVSRTAVFCVCVPLLCVSPWHESML